MTVCCSNEWLCDKILFPSIELPIKKEEIKKT